MKGLKIFLWNAIINNIFSYGLRSFFFKLLLGNRIHKTSAIHHGLKVFCTSGISIGENSVINKNVSLDGRGCLKIGNNVSISAGTFILTGTHDVDSQSFNFVAKEVVIEDYVWIGVRSLILPGVILHKGCVVAAGSVVTKNAEPYSIVGGNPAKHIKFRNSNLFYNPVWRPFLQ